MLTQTISPPSHLLSCADQLFQVARASVPSARRKCHSTFVPAQPTWSPIIRPQVERPPDSPSHSSREGSCYDSHDSFIDDEGLVPPFNGCSQL